MSMTEPVVAADIPTRPAPRCPECGEPMAHYGGSAGYICHDFKLLVRGDGWFDESGAHVKDRRLNNQTVDGVRRH